MRSRSRSALGADVVGGCGHRDVRSAGHAREEEIEVRCGMDGVRLWRLARADDRRRPFGAQPRTLPRALCAWTDYALRDGERLLFVINRLLGHVCDALQARGEGARELLLHFALANRAVIDQPLRAAHPTADRTVWLRLARTTLESLRLPDAVTGITAQIRVVVPLIDQQGDVFDRGFATARATEQAVAQLLDTCGADAVALTLTDHPLLERRAQWRVREPVVLESAYAALERTRTPMRAPGRTPARTPARTTVRSRTRTRPACRPFHWWAHRSYGRASRCSSCQSRGRCASSRFRGATTLSPSVTSRGGTAIEVLIAVGPDRVEGGLWETAPYAREYFHCVSGAGQLVLLFQAIDGWYLHGWWD